MNVDPIELKKFSEKAHRWWDPSAEFKPLHQLNPVRLNYIDQAVSLKHKKVIDVGCGGGILSESMAACGAVVKGIDLSDEALKIAQLHSLETGVKLDYQKISAEDLASVKSDYYDVVTCMELLEHVPNPRSMVQACAKLVRPSGHVFFSTLNRNLKSYLVAVLGAEYLLNVLPRGTHDYAKFIRPSELAQFCREAGLEVIDIVGMRYNPLTEIFSLNKDVDVNYIVQCNKC